MSEIIPFSFPLNQGMHAFLRIRDGLRCLEESQDVYAWLQASADLRSSILGEQGRRPVLPEVIGLLGSMQAHLEKIAADHPEFAENIQYACDSMGEQIRYLHDEQETIATMFSEHALLNRYVHAIKKYDWLGHKYSIPQGIQSLWKEMPALSKPLMEKLNPLMVAVKDLDIMLHDSEVWQSYHAVGGVDEVSPDNTSHLSLLVVGLSREQVQSGLIPEVSGNRMTIRIHFYDWTAQGQPVLVKEDVPYQRMLVPIG